ncbi:hypothetical protein Tco_0149102 [Tanacetum coccineum]
MLESIEGGFFFKPNPGCTLERKWEKHKLYRRTQDVWELHRRSDLVEISDVSMRVFFVMSEELFVLNEGKQTVLKLKVVRGNLGHNDGILLTHARMTKVIKGEFEKIKDIKVEDDSLTCNSLLKVFNLDDDSEHEADDMGFDPSDIAFTEWKPGTFIIENQLHYQDYEVGIEALEDSKLKDEALRNKAIMGGFIKDGDDELSFEQMRRWGNNIQNMMILIRQIMMIVKEKNYVKFMSHWGLLEHQEIKGEEFLEKQRIIQEQGQTSRRIIPVGTSDA